MPRKMLAACLILLTIFTPPALAAGRRFVIRDAYDCRVLVDEEGVLYTPAGVYREIYEATEGEWSEEERLFWAAGLAVAVEYEDGIEWNAVLLDAWGNPVTDGREEKGRFYADSLGMPGEQPDFTENGLLYADGSVAFEPKFVSVCSNGEGGHLAMYPLDEDYKDRLSEGERKMASGAGFLLLRVDADGTWADTGLTVYDLGEFSDGLAPVRIRVGETAIFEDDFREGYVDARGKLAIAPNFREVWGFAAGVAKVKAENGLWGLIRPDGSWALAPEYNEILSHFKGDSVFLAYADKYHTARLIDRESFSGVMSFPAEYGYALSSRWGWDNVGERIAPGLFCLIQDNGDGQGGTYAVVVDAEGRELFRAEGAKILEYDIDMAGPPPVLIMKKGSWQYLVNLRGEEVSAYFSDLVPHLAEGGELRFRACRRHAPVTEWGVIDASGAYLLQPVFESLENLGHGRYLAEYQGKYGVFHESGVEILPVQYDSLIDLGDGLFEARLGDRHGILDIDGNWRIAFSDYEALVD